MKQERVRWWNRDGYAFGVVVALGVASCLTMQYMPYKLVGVMWRVLHGLKAV